MRSAEHMILDVLGLIEDEKNERGDAIGAWDHETLAARITECVLEGYGVPAPLTFVDGEPVPKGE